MAADSVISLAERLKQRREELGITQAQAARELDVARTAYRLWELEAAKPAPDRWRLISRWLGVSVTTMLLAEELLTEEEAGKSNAAEFAYNRSGADWDTIAESKPGDFFAQAHALVQDGVERGDIGDKEAIGLRNVLHRIAGHSSTKETGAWKPAELRKVFDADPGAAKHARDAITIVTVGLPTDIVEVARRLVSELVTNSLSDGGPGEGSTVGLFVSVGRERLRVEVSDAPPTDAPPTYERSYRLLAELAPHWGAGREHGLNITWFELDLAPPGT